MTKSKNRRANAKKAKAVVVVEKIKSKKKKEPAIAIVKGSGDYKVNQFTKMRGRGDYFSDLGGNLLVGLGRSIGSGLGGLVGTAFKTITGMGDYRVKGAKSNSLASLYKTGSNTPFQMSEMGAKFAGGPPRVQHREFIGTIVSPATPAAFSTSVYYIQPGFSGQGSLFPWCNAVASCFEQYVLHGMILEFVSTSADYAATSGLGQVAMSTVYDASASPLADLSEVLNNEYTTTAKPAVSFVHPIECASAQSPVTVRYIRTANTVATDDRLDDVGIFQVTTFGLSATAGTQIGELWATYDVEFLKPVLPDHHIGTTWHANMTTPSLTANQAWNQFQDVTVSPTSSLPATISGGALVLPQGYGGHYLFFGYWVGNGGSAVIIQNDQSLVIPSDVTLLNMFPSPSGTDVGGSLYLHTSTSLAVAALVFSYDGSTSPSIPWSNTVQNGTATQVINGAMFIVPLDNDVLTLKDSIAAQLNKICKGNALLQGLLQTQLSSGASSASSRPAPLRPVPETASSAKDCGRTALDDALLADFSESDEPSSSGLGPPPASRRESDVEVDLDIAAIRSLPASRLQQVMALLR